MVKPVNLQRIWIRRLWDRYRATIYGRLADSQAVARAAVHIRRAATHQIRYRLVDSMEPDKNGESWLISVIARRVETAVDVGANIGKRAEEVLCSCRHLRSPSCFEPSDQATNKLVAAIGTDPRVRIV